MMRVMKRPALAKQVPGKKPPMKKVIMQKPAASVVEAETSDDEKPLAFKDTRPVTKQQRYHFDRAMAALPDTPHALDDVAKWT